MDRKTHQERLNREYGWLYRYIGKGRAHRVVVFISSVFFVSALLSFLLWVFGNISSRNAVLGIISIITIGFLGIFSILIFEIRMRYWRDFTLMRIMLLYFMSMQSFTTGFTFLFWSNEDTSSFFLVILGLLLSGWLILRNYRRDMKKWELAKHKGLLKRYLNEEEWVFNNNPLYWTIIWHEMQAAGRTEEQQTSLIKWLTRLEKLHFLIPGIMISFRRAFGQDELILGVLCVSLGLVLTSASEFPLYFKIREWEREKGKPILLKEMWEEERKPLD